MKSDFDSTRKAKGLIDRTSNQQKLIRIAKNAPDRQVRMAAIKKINDASVLADIAKQDPDLWIRELTVKEIYDQAILSNIATQEDDPDVRRAAVEKLTDHTLLVNIAQHDDKTRWTAVKRLMNLYLHDSGEAAVDAFRAITEQEALVAYMGIVADEIRYKHLNSGQYKQVLDISKEAISKIDDPRILAKLINVVGYYDDIIRYDGFINILETALAKISDEDLLYKVAKDAHEHFGIQAVHKMTKLSYLNELAEYIRTREVSYERESFGASTTEYNTITYDGIAIAATKRLNLLNIAPEKLCR